MKKERRKPLKNPKSIQGNAFACYVGDLNRGRTGKNTLSNPAFQKITRYSQEELETKSALEIANPEDRPLMKKLVQDLLLCKIDRAIVHFNMEN